MLFRSDMVIDHKSIFIRLSKLLYSIIQTYLIWGIYLIFILVLSYQDINSFIQGYMIIVSMMIAVHASVDLSDNKFEGYLSVKPLWTILAIYNTIILFSSYVAYFVIYSSDLVPDFSEANHFIIRTIGIDLDKNESELRIIFLPQFVIL